MTAIVGVCILSNGISHAVDVQNKASHESIEGSLLEDLMWQHCFINRVLLVYEEIIAWLEKNRGMTSSILLDALTVVQDFIHGYHEKLQEQCIFPVFEKRESFESLIKELQEQHRMARLLTDDIVHRSRSERLRTMDNRRKLVASLRKFVTMYRTHMSREDTMLYPALQTTLSPQAYAALNKTLDDEFEKRLGSRRLDELKDLINELEKKLSIDNINRVTPKIKKRGSMVSIV